MSTHPTQAGSRLQPQAQPPVSRRPYRSKRNRPCALCRYRKISCRIIDNDVSCASCRKSGKHCSFIDDPPRSRQSGNSEVPPDMPGEAASLDTNIANLDSEMGDASTAVIEEGAFNWDPSIGTFNHDVGYNYLDNRNNLEFSAYYDGTHVRTSPQGGPGDATPWLNSSAETSQDSHLVLSAPSISVYENGPRLRSVAGDLRLDEISGAGARDLDSVDVGANSFPFQFPSTASLTQQTIAGNRSDISSPRDQGREANSIDQRSEFHGTHFGLSGESDPYLLRHILYNESNEFPVIRVMYRATEKTPEFPSSPSNLQKGYVPVHFMLTSNEIGDEAQKVGPTHNPGTPQSVKLELENLVCDEHGRRLILLFIEYVFPALPVVSRSQLAQSTLYQYPLQINNLEVTPPYLLAAIYASALEFGSYDDVLCLSDLYQKPSAENLWQMVYEGVQSQLHTPRLATISAALLYLNKTRTGVQHISVDTPFTWTFAASAVALATSLGLHLDCSTWSIPDWEKRLRRRLWWTTFCDEKWRCLLFGRPSLIARDQWNVSGLSSHDFVMEQLDKSKPHQDLPAETEIFLKMLHSSGKKHDNALLSQQMASLALIADKIYTDLYTIRAAQTLASDLTASINTVRPLRETLVLWYSRLPATLQSPKKMTLDMSVPVVPNSVACLHFAYITLEVLLYRALLRPLENVDFEQDSIQLQPESQGNNVFNNGIGNGLNDSNTRQDMATHTLSDGRKQEISLDQIEAIICAAEKCAILVTNFTAELKSWDFAGFWYSWSRIGWATTSSFLTLLLVQSPSVEHATTCKALLDKWRQILRHQSKSFQDMTLGTLRLDAMYWSDMRKRFKINRHVEKVLNISV